jgi:5-methylcytosine-specific restriction endonuclease McrA
MVGPKKSKVFSQKKLSGRKYDYRKAWTDMYKTPTWESYRRRFLSVNEHCYVCDGKATVVDHVIPHKGDKALFEKLDNHIPMCASCHNRVTALFDKHYKGDETLTAKLRWLSTRRYQDGNTRKVKVLGYYSM